MIFCDSKATANRPEAFARINPMFTQIKYQALKPFGAWDVCLRKKLEKLESCSNPRDQAISEIFQSVCFRSTLASCNTRPLMISVVVLPVVSFKTLLR